MTELGDALARLLPVCAVRGCSNGTRSTPDNRHTERVLRPAAGKDMADTHVPLVGFGTFNSWQDAGKVAEAVVTAVEIGYRHIDCASFYDNEKEIGQSLKQLFERKLVQRSDLFLVSKLPQPCHARADVRPRLEQTLADLGVESVDLYLIHWPESWTLASWQGQVAYSGVGAETLINVCCCGILPHVFLSRFCFESSIRASRFVHTLLAIALIVATDRRLGRKCALIAPACQFARPGRLWKSASRPVFASASASPISRLRRSRTS
eukprot:m.889728 g.889728  ORF g.889728 m.889728 type:complete len:265 (-) comp59947_c0_seq3:4322-5116(-)